MPIPNPKTQNYLALYFFLIYKIKYFHILISDHNTVSEKTNGQQVVPLNLFAL